MAPCTDWSAELRDEVGALSSTVEALRGSVAALTVETKHRGFRSTTAPEAGEAILKAAGVPVLLENVLGLAGAAARAATPPAVLTAVAGHEHAMALARGEGSKESDVQSAITGLLQRLSVMEGSTLAVHDTHARSLLRDPESRVDISLTVKGQSAALWSNLVMAVELKAHLSAAREYRAAVSQVYERAIHMLGAQPERVFVVAGVADAKQIEFWRFERAGESELPHRLLRTGLQPLDLTAESEGYVAQA